VEPKSTTRADFIEECKSGALDGVVAAYRTFESVKVTGRIDEELVAALPKSLKFIAHNGTFLLSKLTTGVVKWLLLIVVDFQVRDTTR
jgi:hypothetical protein